MVVSHREIEEGEIADRLYSVHLFMSCDFRAAIWSDKFIPTTLVVGVLSLPTLGCSGQTLKSS
jgi:hypothetical protein